MSSIEEGESQREEYSCAVTADQYSAAYQAHFGRTVRHIRCYGQDLDTAEEIAQAAWTQGWVYLRQLRDADKIYQWINKIASNLLMVRFQTTKNHCALDDLVQTLEVDPKQERKIEAHELLKRCTNSERQLLLCSTVEGQTCYEISLLLGISSLAVRVRLCRLRKRLVKDTQRSAAATASCRTDRYARVA